MSKEKKYQIAEIFGPTVQGEGVLIGRQTLFIRTFGCDSYCTQCDSMFAVDPKHPDAFKLLLTVPEIIKELDTLDPDRRFGVTFSGGNPVLWDLQELVDAIIETGRPIWVETQGTLYKDWLLQCDVVTVSPKGPGMNDIKKGVLSVDNLRNFLIQPFRASQVVLKVVIFGDPDLEYAEMLATYFPDVPLYLSVGNTTITDNPGLSHSDIVNICLHDLEILSQEVLKRKQLSNAIVLPQLHVLMWGNKQGV